MRGKLMMSLFCLLLVSAVVYKLDTIVNFAVKLFNSTPRVVVDRPNTYAKRENYDYVQITDDFVPYNYQELINIFYTILDAGYDTFTFYCPSEYLDCITDVVKISDNENVDILTTIGNYVSPYNNFSSLNVSYDQAGEITIDVNHLYSKEEIKTINAKIDEIWNEIVEDDMDTEDIIYVFHDYIINHATYDKAYEKELKLGQTTYESSKAYGPLFQGYAICSGYTDAMALVLDRLKVTNYKVASATHVWNAVKIDNKWLHLDLTWDDPSDNPDKPNQTNYLYHNFYLINTPTLEDFDIENHSFDKSIYTELK